MWPQSKETVACLMPVRDVDDFAVSGKRKEPNEVDVCKGRGPFTLQHFRELIPTFENFENIYVECLKNSNGSLF